MNDETRMGSASRGMMIVADEKSKVDGFWNGNKLGGQAKLQVRLLDNVTWT